jgi:hypothetical protein
MVETEGTELPTPTQSSNRPVLPVVIAIVAAIGVRIA